MSQKQNRSPAGDRRIRVRGVRRDPPDLRKLSRALIALALAQAQADAEAAAANHKTSDGQEGSPDVA
jgi:hypothetical protein